MKKYILCIFYYFITTTILAQSFVQEYDLDFAKLEIKEAKRTWYNWKWVKFRNSADFILGAVDISQSKRKPLSITKSKFSKAEDAILFHASKTIVLPQLNKLEAVVSLSSKLEKEGTAFFKATTFDSDKVELHRDSLIIESRSWTKNDIPLNLQTAKFLLLEFGYLGGSEDIEQKVQFNDLKLRIGGEPITDLLQLEKLASKQSSVAKLNTKYVVPFFTSKNDVSPQISQSKEIETAKIIGLGDFSDGTLECDSIFRSLAKQLVEKSNCKLLMVDARSTQFLIVDLYIQGLIPNKYKDIVNDILIENNRDPKVDLDFVMWLREFNKTQDKKVHLLSIGQIWQPRNFYFDMMAYFLALFDDEDYNDFLRYAELKDEQALYQKVLDDKNLETKIRAENYAVLLYYLERNQGIANSSPTKESESNQILHNITNVSKAILSEDEKAIVFAHSRHLGNSEEKQIDGSTTYSAGYYLKKDLQEKYYSASIQAGSGDVLLRFDTYYSAPYKDTIALAPTNSFEYAALQVSNLDYFLYPSKHLDKNIYKIQSIYTFNEYIATSLPKRFDAYIFSKKSTPHTGASVRHQKLNYFTSNEEKLKNRVYLKHKELYIKGEEQE